MSLNPGTRMGPYKSSPHAVGCPGFASSRFLVLHAQLPKQEREYVGGLCETFAEDAPTWPKPETRSRMGRPEDVDARATIP